MIPRSTRRSSWLYAALPAALTAVLYSCSGGGGGGGPPAVTEEVEPNGTFAEATPLTINRAGHGVMTDAADVDFWSIDIADNTFVSIELFGTRMDQPAWDGSDSIPRITVYDTDGTTVLLNHDYTNIWSWGKHDLDHPLLHVTDGGTYFLTVTVDGAAVTDGDYAIRVNRLSESGLQTEAATPGATNDTFDTAEAITPGLVEGFHTNGDHDYYSFEITSPSVVRFEMFAYRNGVFAEDDNDYDTFLDLYDTDGTTNLFSNDDAFFYDSGIQYQLNTPGTYFIDVNEFDSGTNGSPYILTFSRSAANGSNESEPNEAPETADSIAYGGAVKGNVGEAGVDDLDGFKFSGTKGDMVRVQIFDSFTSEGKADEVFATIYGPDATTALPFGGDGDFHTYTTILQETGTHYIVVEPFIGQTDYRVELTRFRSATAESEPNNTVAEADSLGSGGRSAGVIEVPAPGALLDVDVFSFSASADRLTTISIYASFFATDSDGFVEFSGHGSDLEPQLRILDAEGGEVAISTSDWSTVTTEDVVNGLPCAAVSFIAATGGTYYVEVSDAFDASGPTYYYVIEKTN